MKTNVQKMKEISHPYIYFEMSAHAKHILLSGQISEFENCIMSQMKKYRIQTSMHHQPINKKNHPF